jgi:NADPH2:quinone reductase
MKAIRFHAVGGPEVLRLEEIDEPRPKAGEVLIAVRAIGVNFADTRFRRGEYFVRPVFPAIPGMEAAGEVVARGEGVTTVAVGDRVMALGAAAYAERMIARAADCFPMPAALEFERASALPIQGLTAHHTLFACARLLRGERVLVHAGAGGVGTLAIQLAKRAGAAAVIATAGSPEKLQLTRELGADFAIDYRQSDWVAQVKEATGGRGVDVILEMLGGTDAYKRNLACLAPMGRMVVYGAASGDTKGTLEPIGLMGKNHSVIGYYLTGFRQDRERCAGPLAELADATARGELRVIIGKTAPLAEAETIHREMESRATVGKLVLTP